jgi:AGZA family xanthine/uracil permease-like MFS transporter
MNQSQSPEMDEKKRNGFDRFFKISKRGSSLSKEIIGGVIIFLAMLYILPVNADLLAKSGLNYAGVFAATAISAGFASILMGAFANYPIALASGMGINAFFTYTAVLGLGFSPAECLAAVLVDGVLFIILSLTGLRKRVINAIPKNLKLAIGVGIGFFIAFVGFKDAGIIVSNNDTAVAIGDLSNPSVLLAVIGLVLALVLSTVKGKINHFAIIISMVTIAIIALILGLCGVDGMPTFDFTNFFKGTFSEMGTGLKETVGQCFTGIGSLFRHPEAFGIIFSFTFVDFFDTCGTLVAVGHDANLFNENGELVDGEKALLVDAVGTVVGAVLGTSTVTSFAESTTGIEAGARTGLSACVAGVLFLLSLLIYPVFSIFTSISTSLALILVGCFMFKQIGEMDFNDTIGLFASFITIIMMILGYSIATGIAWGFITYTIMMLFGGRSKEVSPAMYVLSVLFILNFIVNIIVTKQVSASNDLMNTTCQWKTIL